MFVLRLLILVAVPLMVCGCGSHAQKPAPPAGSVPYVPANHVGGIRGVVKWDGDVPERAAIDASADPKVRDLYASAPLLNESLLIENGRVRNAVVFLRSGHEKWIFPAPAESVRVQVTGARFEPRTVALLAGQRLVFSNADNFYHALLGVPRQVNGEFNVSLHKTGDTVERTFQYSELAYRVTSDIRKWMHCNVCVFYHPFHAVTGVDGSFELKNVPDGEYLLDVWVERTDVQLPNGTSVTVKGGMIEQPLVLKKKPNL